MRNTVHKGIIYRSRFLGFPKAGRETMIPHSDLMNQALAQVGAGGVLVWLAIMVLVRISAKTS